MGVDGTAVDDSDWAIDSGREFWWSSFSSIDLLSCVKVALRGISVLIRRRKGILSEPRVSCEWRNVRLNRTGRPMLLASSIPSPHFTHSLSKSCSAVGLAAGSLLKQEDKNSLRLSEAP